MKGKSALFWLGLAAAAGGVLFQTSYEVQELEDKLGSLNRQIMDEQEAIQILKAEWSYLNDPTRLESLASQHLQLQPTEARQFVAMDVVPMRPVPPPDAAKNDGPKAGDVLKNDGKRDGVAPLPPMVRLAPSAPGTAVASGNNATNNGGIIPASLPSGMATPAKPAPIKPSALIPGAGKAPALPAAKAAPASAPTVKQVDVAARPTPSQPMPTQTASAPSTVKTLSVPAAKQPAAQPAVVAAVPAPPAPKATDSIGVLVARLGANR